MSSQNSSPNDKKPTSKDRQLNFDIIGNKGLAVMFLLTDALLK